MSPIIYSGLDSDILTHNFSPEKIKIAKYLKGLLRGNEGNGSIIKLYKILGEDDLREYQQIHNNVSVKYHLLDKELIHNGNTFKSIILNVLQLEDNFIDKKQLLSLYNKDIKKILEKYFEENKVNSISVQKYIEGPTLRDVILDSYTFDDENIGIYNTNPFAINGDYLDPVNVKIIGTEEGILKGIITDSSNYIQYL